MNLRSRLVPIVVALAGVAVAGCDHAVVSPRTDAERGKARTARPPAGPVSLPVLSSCPPPARRAGADRAGSARVVVTDRTRQAIDGWGASVVSDTYVDPLVQPSGLPARQVAELDRRVFREAGINLVRVFGPGYGRAPVVAPPEVRARDRVFAFMRRVAPYGVRFMFTGADAPPDLKQGRALRPGAEEAYAGYIADYLGAARAAGVPFSFAAVANEPENRASRLQMSPEQAALVYRALALEMTSQEMATRLVLGDTTGWRTGCSYALLQTALPEVRGAADAVATHAYYGTVDDARAFAEQAARAGLRSWQTEFGTGCSTCPDDPSIHGAVTWSAEIAKALEAGRTSAWFAFRAVADRTHGPADGLLVRDRRSRRVPFYPTKRFEVFRQYSNYGPPGSRVLEVVERIPEVIAVAFESEGRTSVVVTNLARTGTRRLELDLGGQSGTIEVRRTSGSEDFKPLPALAYRGAPAVVDVPADSVTTFTLD